LLKLGFNTLFDRFAPYYYLNQKNPIFMKKLLTFLMLAFLTLTSIETQAQAFDKSTKLLSLTLGPGEMIHFGGNDGYVGSATFITGQLNFQGEFAVHQYVGVGFTVGVGGRASGLVWPAEANVPIGVLANFHFYQLIADKKGGDLHADKLDIYAGITAGSGVFIRPNLNNFAGGLFYFGPHAGVNYYFSKNVGVNGEVGWGTTVIQAGLVFKLGGK
jgi:hypothetical protein